ncbi:hypothetical protein [Bacteroides stercoris]|uniref:hypothetical protein n=1 Tax=Bacteroides stercoris TaxID=46506 RepID=UPI00129D2219|nr:hypothetical protein [Bacteroides stercoris]
MPKRNRQVYFNTLSFRDLENFTDFTERKSGKAVFSVRVYSSHEVDKFVLRDEFIRLVG